MLSVKSCVLFALAATVAASPSAPSLKPGKIAEGFLEGFLSDQPDLKSCVGGSSLTLEDVEEALGDIRQLHVVKGLRRLAEALNGIPVAMKECRATAADVRDTIHTLTTLGGPVQLALHSSADALTYFGDVLEELKAATNGCGDGQYEYCGKELGLALRRIIVGKASTHEPICRMGEPQKTCKINGDGCDSKPVTFEPLNLTVWKWDKATKKYGEKPVGQLEAHVAAGSDDDWQMYLHGPMFRPWREMCANCSHPPVYVQATWTNKVYRFDDLHRAVDANGLKHRGQPMTGTQKVVAHAIAPSTSFPIETNTGELQGMLVAEGQPFLLNAPFDPKHVEMDFGGVDYITDKCQRVYPNKVDRHGLGTGGDVVNTVACHPYTGICFFSVWKFYEDQPPFWNKFWEKLHPDCLHYCVTDGLDKMANGCKKGGVVKDEHGVPICSKHGVGAVHGFTVAFGANLTHKDPNEFDLFLVFTGGAQFVGGESSLSKVLCKKDASGDLAVIKSQRFGDDLFMLSVNRTNKTGMAPVDVGGDHAWADESGKYLWVSTFRTENAGVHMLDYETGELIYSIHGTATYQGPGVKKHNYAYSAGIHGGGWLGHERGVLLVGTSACTHPKSACFPVPYNPITKAIGMEATGLMYMIDLSEMLPPPEDEKTSTMVV